MPTLFIHFSSVCLLTHAKWESNNCSCPCTFSTPLGKENLLFPYMHVWGSAGKGHTHLKKKKMYRLKTRSVQWLQRVIYGIAEGCLIHVLSILPVPAINFTLKQLFLGRISFDFHIAMKMKSHKQQSATKRTISPKSNRQTMMNTCDATAHTSIPRAHTKLSKDACSKLKWNCTAVQFGCLEEWGGKQHGHKLVRTQQGDLTQTLQTYTVVSQVKTHWWRHGNGITAGRYSPLELVFHR